MAPLPANAFSDPTLEAADRAMEAAARKETPRDYLGFSAIGHPCSRKLWYDLHLDGSAKPHSASTLKMFADGHASEAIQARRFRMVDGVTLWIVDPDTGRQFGFSDLDGRFKGHMDGAIYGLLQAPKAWHVWEHKCANEKKQAKLLSFKSSLGEKAALQAWDPVYYAQAVLYMHYSGMDRHYLTCASPGTRHTISVRTNADTAFALVLRDKAERILNARAPLAKLSNDPAWWQCRWCEHHARCHGVASEAATSEAQDEAP